MERRKTPRQFSWSVRRRMETRARTRARFSADREPCKSITSSSTWPVPREMARSSSGSGSEASQVSGNGDVIGKLMHAGVLVCDCQVATTNESAIGDEKRSGKGETGEVESRDCGFERVLKYTCTGLLYMSLSSRNSRFLISI